MSIEALISSDKFSQWLGIKIVKLKTGYSKIQMTIREEMVNALGITHGGIVFSLADSAFGFACNTNNNISVALDVSITFNKPSKPGDILTAEAKQLHDGKHTGLYLVTIINKRKEQIALFKGTCFKTGKKIQ